MPFFKKRLRLPPDHYVGRRIYFVTIGTEKRAPFFANQSTGQWLLNHPLEIAAQQSFSFHAYCVMPDHVHFLWEGFSDTSHLIRFVNAFKTPHGLRISQEANDLRHHSYREEDTRGATPRRLAGCIIQPMP